MTRVSLIHTGSFIIQTFIDLGREHLADVDVQHLLDDRIVADLRSGVRREQIVERLVSLGQAAVTSGATSAMITCSSISLHADEVSERIGIPVYRVDEAMADAAVALGDRIAVVATLDTTLPPTVGLVQDRGAIAGRDLQLEVVLIEGAFDVLLDGDRARHDALIVEAIERLAPQVDAIVLAQASMAGAASKANVSTPVLSSPELGMRRLAHLLAAGAAA